MNLVVKTSGATIRTLDLFVSFVFLVMASGDDAVDVDLNTLRIQKRRR